MRRAGLLAFGLLVASTAFALADPPARVGRLSYVEGTVSFHPPAGQADEQSPDQGADQSQWAPATLNYPVTTGESFWTEPDARAEIQVGPAAIRLDHSTELDVTRLDDNATDLQLDQGALNLHLTQMPPGGVSVMTPRGRVVLTQPGNYSVDAGQLNGDQPSDHVQVAVLDGAARFEGDRGVIDIPRGQTAMISGDPSNVALAAASPNDFDNWALSRERPVQAAQGPYPPSAPTPYGAAAPPPPAYVPPAVTGAQDLARYGAWTQEPDYGAVWYPSAIPADWAPYRYGHWAFVPPWGWTWIDDSPWGFAPFHYGRWASFHGRWGWVPGHYVAAPVYAPALVAFVGGNGWSVSLTAGAPLAAVGWVALAPGEVYHPYYRVTPTYVRQVNVAYVNNTVINNVTVINRNVTVQNFRNASAATVVPAAAFTRAAPVMQSRVTVPAQQMAQLRPATSVNSFQPSAMARIGRADPAVARAVVPQPGAAAQVSTQRVAATTAAANLPAQTVPTAPGPRGGPHNFAAGRFGQGNGGQHGTQPASAPANAPATTPSTLRGPNAAQPGTNQPPTNAPSAQTAPNAPAAAPSNAGRLAPHPLPPHAAQIPGGVPQAQRGSGAPASQAQGAPTPGAPSPQAAHGRAGGPVWQPPRDAANTTPVAATPAPQAPHPQPPTHSASAPANAPDPAQPPRHENPRVPNAVAPAPQPQAAQPQPPHVAPQPQPQAQHAPPQPRPAPQPQPQPVHAAPVPHPHPAPQQPQPAAAHPQAPAPQAQQAPQQSGGHAKQPAKDEKKKDEKPDQPH